MTLTPDDIKRPAVIRLNRVINTLTGVVWGPLLVLAMTLYVIFKLVDDFSDSVRDASCDLRDYLLAAFVKRWPTPKPDFDAEFTRYKNLFREMTPEETIAQRNSWGAGYSASVDKARAAGTYRDTVPTTNDYSRATSAVVATFNGPEIER